MNKHLPGFIAGIVVGGAFATAALAGGPVSATAAAGQTGAKSANNSKVVFENARVRVKDVTFAPGTTTAMHTHDLPHVGVVIQGGTLTFRSPDGKTETMKLEAGGAGYREANVSHEPTNPGKTPVRVIEVELK
jgi:quercetin dioxygenase-like cupin family protein